MNDATGTGQKSLRAGAEERVRWFEKQRRTPKRRGGGSRPKPTQCLPKAVTAAAAHARAARKRRWMQQHPDAGRRRYKDAMQVDDRDG